MRWMFLVGTLAAISGCDFAFGLDDPELPTCLPASFDQARERRLVRDDDFNVASFTKDGVLGVVDSGGLYTLIRSEEREPVARIALEPIYGMVNVAMEPNGDYFFFTAAVEPPVIKAVRASGSGWVFEPSAPKGFMAGTPSDRMFDDTRVRVIVRLSEAVPEFAEYQRAADGTWVELEGHRFTLEAIGGANLSPDGLWIVYDGREDDRRGVYVRQRASLDESFGGNRASQMIFEGVHLQPQLLQNCQRLYAFDQTTGSHGLHCHDR